MTSPQALVGTARRRVPPLDHVLRALSRYLADSGDRLAAAVTYYWFLSLFPILLLAVSVLGFVYGDSATAKVQDALGGVLPEQLVTTIGTTLTDQRAPAGFIGVVGTLYAGLGWINALREAIRTIWHQNISAGNIVVKKGRDAVVLVGLFVTIAASVVATGLATTASSTVLDGLGIQDTPPARAFTVVLGHLLPLVLDTALFLYLYLRLARVGTPWRQVVRGALFGAAGLEVLKVAGAFYVARTTSRGQATYGTFAVVVGLLLFLNLFSRLLLFTAAWTVTGPYDSDVAPSGTSSPQMAGRAGIPEHLAGDDEPALSQDGAQTRLATAVSGHWPEQDDEPGDRPAAATVGRQGPSVGGVPAAVGPVETAVVRAAQVTAAAAATVVAGVGVYTLRALRDLARR